MLELTITQKIAIWAIPLIFAITLHEVAHGWVASLFGDQTARLSGRLSINPIRHVSPVGTILVPLILMITTQFQFIFGWAKPVPVDARNMRHPVRDMAVVALAGPLCNLMMAIVWAALAKVAMLLSQHNHLWVGVPLLYMGIAGIQINIVLGVLNLIPIPPLDGSNILSGILPRRMAYQYSRLAPYGFFILILLMVTGALSMIMGPMVMFLIDLIGALFGLS